MELSFGFAAFGIVMLLAAISPGPDFLVVSKNSIACSRRIGVYTALGIGLGVFVHVAYTLAGIGLIISQSIFLFSAIKFAGAAYLVYLGIQLITEKGTAEVEAVTTLADTAKTSVQAFKEGFITNVLNPKATIFFVSVFSQFMTPDMSFGIKAAYGVEAVGIAGAWFVVLAFILTHPVTKRILSNVQAKLLKFMGAALVLLGVRVASEQ